MNAGRHFFFVRHNWQDRYRCAHPGCTFAGRTLRSRQDHAAITQAEWVNRKGRA